MTVEEVSKGEDASLSVREEDPKFSDEASWNQLWQVLLDAGQSDADFIRVRRTLNFVVEKLRMLRAEWEAQYGVRCWKRAESVFTDGLSMQLWRAYGAASSTQNLHLAAEELAQIRSKGLGFRLSSGQKMRTRLGDCGIKEFASLVAKANVMWAESQTERPGKPSLSHTPQEKTVVVTMTISGDGIYLKRTGQPRPDKSLRIRGMGMKLLLSLNESGYREILERNVGKKGVAHGHLGGQVWGSHTKGALADGQASQTLRRLVGDVNQRLNKILGPSLTKAAWITNDGGAYRLNPNVQWARLSDQFVPPNPPRIPSGTRQGRHGTPVRAGRYLTARPKIRMVKEPKKVPTYVTPAHLEDIYVTACPKAKLPQSPGQTFLAADWWRALVATAYMTGFRIGEILALRWEDLDLEKGILFTRAEDNKGSRDESLRVHPVVIEHLQKVKTDGPYVFRWPHEKSILWEEFARIQREAGIKLVCRHSHNHTPACHVYSFHDFRRAFATVNAPRMKGQALQRLMRHKSYTTTLGYINLASQIDDAVTEMPLPPALQKGRKETPGEETEQP